MGNVANWKTIGKFIIKSEFLILLIRAREGVFLLISCCRKLLGGGGGVTFPHPTHTQTHKHSVLPDVLLETYSIRIILLWYYTMFTWIKISRAWQIDMESRENKHTFLKDFFTNFFVLSFKSWFNLLKIAKLAWTRPTKSSPLILKNHPFKIRVTAGNSNY